MTTMMAAKYPSAKTAIAGSTAKNVAVMTSNRKPSATKVAMLLRIPVNANVIDRVTAN